MQQVDRGDRVVDRVMRGQSLHVDLELRLQLEEARVVDEDGQGVAPRRDGPHGERQVQPVDALEMGRERPVERRSKGIVEEREVESASVVRDDGIGTADKPEEGFERARRVRPLQPDQIAERRIRPLDQLIGDPDEAIERGRVVRPRLVGAESDGTNLEERPFALRVLLGVPQDRLKIDDDDPPIRVDSGRRLGCLGHRSEPKDSLVLDDLVREQFELRFE